MKKEELFDFLSESFEGESMEDVSTLLEKMHQWVEEYRRQYFKGYMHCKHCGCYSKHKEFVYQVIYAKELLQNDYESDVYNVKRGIYLCPKCGRVADSLDFSWDLIETKKRT